jgi:signal transduction histidine kinase
MSWIVPLELCGMVCALLAARLSARMNLTRDLSLGLAWLLTTVAALHLLDALEWYGFGWADWLGDTTKVAVPVAWLVFLFAVSRAELVTDLQSAAAQLRDLIESAPAALSIVDARGRCVHCNHQWSSLHHAEGPIVGVPLSQSCGAAGVHWEHLSQRVIASRKPLQGSDKLALGGDETADLEWSVRPWVGLEGVGAIIAVVQAPNLGSIAPSDIKTATRTRALEAIGAAASGVAHDINNLLTVISMHSEVLHLLRGQDPEAMKSSLDSIQQAIGTASSMTRELLSFSKVQSLELQPLDLTALVEANAKLLEDTVRGKAQLCLEAQPAVWVSANASALQQILLNLVVNGRDAMRGQGAITIRVEVTVNGPSLEVEDSGSGIEPEILSRMFEPFFTTKRERGTGLGLAVVDRLVRAQGANILVKSSVGLGTTFVITFPPTALDAKHGPPVRRANDVS